jgi:hypothetical protein
LRLKNIEVFSDHPEFQSGVFRTLVGRVEDCHRASVLVTASNFDFQSFHLIEAPANLCTLVDAEPPWIQFELVKGWALMHGYRFKHVPVQLFGEWSVQGSNNLQTWAVIDRRREPPGTVLLKVYECRASMAFRYFRFVYEVQQTKRTLKLRIRHFDIFGEYFERFPTHE